MTALTSLDAILVASTVLALIVALGAGLGWFLAERRADQAADARDTAIKQSVKYWEALRKTRQQLAAHQLDEAQHWATVPREQAAQATEQFTALLPVQPNHPRPAARRDQARPVRYPSRRNHS
jgi:steroid 5-alpha reductase family enzyme